MREGIDQPGQQLKRYGELGRDEKYGELGRNHYLLGVVVRGPLPGFITPPTPCDTTSTYMS